MRTRIESLQNRIPSDLSEPHEHILQSLENFRRSLDSYNEERRIFQEALRASATVLTARVAYEMCSRPGSRGVSPKAGAYSLAMSRLSVEKDAQAGRTRDSSN